MPQRSIEVKPPKKAEHVHLYEQTGDGLAWHCIGDCGGVTTVEPKGIRSITGQFIVVPTGMVLSNEQ